jgi:hypothetical protein
VGYCAFKKALILPWDPGLVGGLPEIAKIH